MSEPLRWTHPDAEPPPEARELLRALALAGPPSLPADIRAQIRGGIETSSAARLAGWQRPTLAVLAVAAGIALVWGLTGRTSEPPPVSIESVVEQVGEAESDPRAAGGVPEPTPETAPETEPAPEPEPEPTTAPAPVPSAEGHPVERAAAPGEARPDPPDQPTAPAAVDQDPDPRLPIRALIRRGHASLQSCFDLDPAGHPAFIRVEISASVNPEGQATLVSPRGPTTSRTLHCMRLKVLTWRFEGSEHGVNYTFPVLFRTVNGRPVPPDPVLADGRDPYPVNRREEFESEAQTCTRMGDNACVIRLLEGGRARTSLELRLLIEAYRARGQTSTAVRHMRLFVQRFPSHRSARSYRQILDWQ